MVNADATPLSSSRHCWTSSRSVRSDPKRPLGAPASIRMPHVRHWHFSDVLRQSSDVRCWGLNRP